MKKIIAILLVLLMALTFVFADEKADMKASLKEKQDTLFFDSLQGYEPYNPKYMGMGGAGLAINKGVDDLFTNPSVLGQGIARFSIPSVTVTVNHVYDLMKKDENGDSAIDKVEEMLDGGELSTESMTKLAPVISDLIGSGKGKIASVDASFGLIANALGFAVNVNDTVRTFNGDIFDDIKVSAAVGFGLGFGGDSFRVNAGVTGKLNINAITQTFGVSKALAIAKDSEELWSTPLAYGYGIPVDAGVTVALSNFKISAVVSNINIGGLGEYKYNIATVGEMKDNPSSAIEKVKDIKDSTAAFKYTPKTTLDFGVGYAPKGGTGFKFAYDIIDVLGMKDKMDAGYSFKNTFIAHSRMGVEFSLINFLKVRGGLNSGYFTVGGTVNIGIITLDCAYFWEEMGTVSGQKGLDGVSVRVNIGWDN